VGNSQSNPNEFHVYPFTVIVDTREQSAFGFRGLRADARDGGGEAIIKTERRTLKTGDYSVVGMEDQVTVERKELGDLFNCMGQDRRRFEDQLRRLNEMQHGVLVVEAGFDRIMRGHSMSDMKPKSVLRSIMAYQMKPEFRNIHWWCCPSRAFAERVTFRILEMFWRKFQ